MFEPLAGCSFSDGWRRAGVRGKRAQVTSSVASQEDTSPGRREFRECASYSSGPGAPEKNHDLPEGTEKAICSVWVWGQPLSGCRTQCWISGTWSLVLVVSMPDSFSPVRESRAGKSSSSAVARATYFCRAALPRRCSL